MIRNRQVSHPRVTGRKCHRRWGILLCGTTANRLSLGPLSVGRHQRGHEELDGFWCERYRQVEPCGRVRGNLHRPVLGALHNYPSVTRRDYHRQHIN